MMIVLPMAISISVGLCGRFRVRHFTSNLNKLKIHVQLRSNQERTLRSLSIETEWASLKSVGSASNQIRDNYSAVASLTIPGGQEFHFSHFSLKFRSIFLIFPQTLLILFLMLALRVGESPTREGPGYVTG